MLLAPRALALLLCCCLYLTIGQLLPPEKMSKEKKQEAESLATSLFLGDVDVLQGAFIGDVALVTKGLQAGALVNPLLSRKIGETTLAIGKAWVDFPVAPALHVCFFCGRKENLNVAHVLLRKGAGLFDYQLPSSSGDSFQGYPIAIAYALGLGATPNNEHASFLQRTHATFPHLFEDAASAQRIEKWRNDTGNPPLLHIPILRPDGVVFFDGVYTLVTDFKYDVDNAADAWGVTPLHLAAWLGDSHLLRFLLFHKAKVDAVDSYGRTPVHYAAVRGHSDAIFHLLDLFNKAEKKQAAAAAPAGDNDGDSTYRRVLTMKDRGMRTPLQLAELTPLQNYSSDVLRYAMGLYEVSAPRNAAAAAAVVEDAYSYSLQESDAADRRGGWHFPLSDSDGAERAAAAAVAGAVLIDRAFGPRTKKGLFKRDYFFAQRPLLLQELFSGQAIWAYWQREEFAHRYGSVMVQCGERRHSSDTNPWSLPPVSSMTLRQWVHEYMGSVSDCHLVDQEQGGSSARTCRVVESLLEGSKEAVRKPSRWPAQAADASHQSPASRLSADVRRPLLFDICGGDRAEDIGVTLGPAGSSVPPHSHNAPSWSLLLAGIKVWYFVSPGDAKDALRAAASNSSQQVPQGAAAHTVLGTREWAVQVLPLLRQAGLVVSQTIQRAGDTVFVPAGYLHATMSMADTVSLSQQFCAPMHSAQRTHPLGSTLYGGKDAHRGTGEINRLRLDDKYIRQRRRDRERELGASDGVPRFQ